MLAAAADHGSVAVRRRPRVAILQTGDEIGASRQRHKDPAGRHRLKRYGIAALARAAGAEVTDLGLVGDSLSASQEAVAGALAGGFRRSRHLRWGFRWASMT